MTERINVTVDGDSESLRRELRAAAAETKAFSSEVERSRRPLRAAAADNERAATSYRELGGAVRGFNMSLTTSRNVMRLVKPAALITGMGMAAGAMNSAAAGAAGLASSLTPLLGLLPAAGQGALAFAQAAGTVKLATSGLSEALQAHAADAKAAGTASVASAKQQVSSERAVADAKRSLIEAQEDASVAQRGLTAARREARAELNALKFAAESAALAERGAELGLRRAMQHRREARREYEKGLGTSLDLDEANFGVVEAKAALREARRAKEEQAREAEQLRRRGVEGSKQVVAAQEAIADASEASADAARALSRAQEDSAAATEKAAVAVSAFDEAMKGLPASTQAFVRQLIEMKPLLDELQETAADGLLPGAGAGLTAAARNFDEVNSVIGQTSAVLGTLAEDAGKLAGSKAWGKDISTIGASNARVLQSGGDAALHLADASRHLIVEAAPLTEWLGRSAERLARLVEEEMAAKRETGELADFFAEAREKAERLSSIAGSLAAGLIEVGKAGKPLGDDILEDLDTAADRWEAWTKSVEGENELKAYFADAKPTLYEAAALVDDLATGFLQMGSSPATADLIRQLRVELLPVLLDLVEETTAAFGPHLIAALVEVAKVFGHLAGSSGPLVAFVDAIGKAAEGINWLLENIPGLNEAVITIAATAGIYKALQIGAAITGVKTLHKLLRATPAVAAASGAAAGAGGAAAGAAGGAGTAGAIARFAPKVLPRVLPVVGGTVMAFQLINALPKLEKVQATLLKIMTDPELNKGIPGLGKLREQLADATKDKDVDRIKKVAAAIEEVGKATKGPAGKMLVEVAKDARGVAKAVDDAEVTTEESFKSVRRETAQTADSFSRMRHNTADDMGQVKAVVKGRMTDIKQDLGTKSAEGKAALINNFQQARMAVQRQMQEAGKVTKEGLDLIRKYLVEELTLLGFTPAQAKISARGRGADGQLNIPKNEGRQFAQGGYIGNPGERGRDTVPMQIPHDWAIVNSHQQAALGLAGGGMVNALVGRGELLASPADQTALDQRARTAGYGGLDDVFAKVQTPHYFAKGGIAGMVAAANKVERAGFPYVWGGGHSGSPAPFGPFDCSGAVSYVLQQGGVNIPTMVSGALASAGKPGPGAVTVFANDGHTFMRIGSRYFGTSGSNPGGGAGWMPTPSASYLGQFTQRHFAGSGSGAGFGGEVKRAKWKGPGGMLGSIGQATLDTARKGAQKRLDKVSSSMTIGAGDANVNGGAGAASRGQMVGWAREALTRTGQPASGANIAKLLALAMKESSWVVRSINNWDSNAAAGNPSGGLMHVTLDKVGGSYARLFDPVANMMASIRYQLSRYGGLITFSPYARGKRGIRSPRAKPRSGRGPVPEGGRGKRTRPKPKKLTPLSGIDLGRLDAFDDRLTAAEGNYGRVERGHGLTDESATRQLSLPVTDPGAFQGILAAQPLEAGWLQGLNARGEELDVEVRDEAGISAHVSELRELQGLKGGIAGLVRKQRRVAGEVLAELRAGIAARVKLLEGVKKQLEETVERLKRARARIARRNDRIRDLRRGSESRAQRTQIRELSQANTDDGKLVERLLDDKSDHERNISIWQGRIGDWRGARDQVKDREAAFSGTLGDLRLDVDYLQKDINEWTGTHAAAPKLDAADDDGVKAGLLQQLLDASLRANYLQTQQFGALRGFAPLLGGRMVGSFAHGGRIPETGMAYVHRDEVIQPDPQGPYGSQFSSNSTGDRPINVHLTFADKSGELVRLIDARVDGRAAQVSSRVTGRSSRLISAAPGR